MLIARSEKPSIAEVSNVVSFTGTAASEVDGRRLL
jgi:hypothetical protein